jgi:hypothetical protein
MKEVEAVLQLLLSLVFLLNTFLQYFWLLYDVTIQQFAYHSLGHAKLITFLLIFLDFLLQFLHFLASLPVEHYLLRHHKSSDSFELSLTDTARKRIFLISLSLALY